MMVASPEDHHRVEDDLGEEILRFMERAFEEVGADCT